MKAINFIKGLIVILVVCQITSCEGIIDTDVYSEISGESAVGNETGIRSVLNSAYANSHGADRAYLYLSSMPSGEAWSRGGQIEPDLTALSNFTWNSDHPYVSQMYNSRYSAIRDANIVLDNISNDNFSTEFKDEIMGEAKFIRGWNYALLYKFYGPTPLYKSSSTDSLWLARPSDEEMRTSIEQDLTDAIDALPVDQEEYGKATKGSALGVLCKYYLNTKQWQKSADIAQQIIDMNKYNLILDYADIFSLDNEGNSELLWAITYKAQGAGHNIVALTFPTDYPTPFPNASVYAAEKYYFDDFVNSFEDGDTRKNLIVTEYINRSGEHVQLLGNDKSLPLKYGFDPEATGATYGNDIPVVRYADILLSRAEALNELNGPTQEAFDLINQVRARAKVPLLDSGSFTTESLRDHIFIEREWEFYSEGKRREDQIRHGTFISRAQDRGKSAQPHHILFPIPQTEMDANPNLEQNPGY